MHGGETVRTQTTELMNHREAAQNNPIAYVHMPRQLRTVGKNSVVAHPAIVRQMDIGHDPVVVAQLGDTCVARRANVERTKLADGIALANDQLTGLAGIFFILRHCT